MDLYYRNFRAVCTAAVHDEIVNMGGNGKTVEIGVISLGTTTSDGNKREVNSLLFDELGLQIAPLLVLHSKMLMSTRQSKKKS